MRHALLLTTILGLAACSTVSEVTGDSALSGHDLDAAVGLYGPWEDFVVLDGRPTYIWRRHYVDQKKNYYCELRVEMGFRRTISRSTMQGFPDACRLFSVRYKSNLN